MNFADQLKEAILKKRNPCVVGLDPRPEMFPTSLQPTSTDNKSIASKIYSFNKKMIDLCAEWVPAVKPQIAFYERYGPHGYESYENTIAYAHKKGLLVIGDVKRGDIGSTAEAYAEAHLGEGSEFADAITVNPFFGTDGVAPFLEVARKREKGLFFLVQTSNPSSAEIQGIRSSDGMSVSEKTANLVARWGRDFVGESGYSAAGAVVGATQTKDLTSLRKRLPKTFFLLPGYGAQGGKASDLAPAFDDAGLGGLVSSSRAVLFAYLDPKYKDEKSWETSCVAALRAMIEDVQGAIQKS